MQGTGTVRTASTYWPSCSSSKSHSTCCTGLVFRSAGSGIGLLSSLLDFLALFLLEAAAADDDLPPPSAEPLSTNIANHQ